MEQLIEEYGISIVLGIVGGALLIVLRTLFAYS